MWKVGGLCRMRLIRGMCSFDDDRKGKKGGELEGMFNRKVEANV